MIRVRIKRKKNGNISSFQMSGHAEFAEYGQDIVCAGASAVSFGTVNAIMQVAGLNPKSASPKEAFGMQNPFASFGRTGDKSADSA